MRRCPADQTNTSFLANLFYQRGIYIASDVWNGAVVGYHDNHPDTFKASQFSPQALLKNDFEKGAASLITLQRVPGLTPDQARLVFFTLRQLQLAATRAAANRDLRGDKALELLRGTA